MYKLFTIKEVSRILSREEYEIRYWSFKFNSLLTAEQEYSFRDIEVLATICYLNKTKDINIHSIYKYLNDKTDKIVIADSKTEDLEIKITNDNMPILFTKQKYVALSINIAKPSISSTFCYSKNRI